MSDTYKRKLVVDGRQGTSFVYKRLYVCLTFGEGTTEYVFMILSGYSSLILEIRRVPIPDPVPPPRE